MDVKDLRHFGIPAANIRWLGKAAPENIEYLDLVEGISLQRGDPLVVKPDAVIESGQQPLLYLLSGSLLPSSPTIAEERLITLRHKLAQRGEGTYFALSEPGKLTIYTVGLGDKLPVPVIRRLNDPDAVGLFAELSSGPLYSSPKRSMEEADKLGFREHLFKLLTEACDDLLKHSPFKERKDDALSLIGRALFARFLIDRGLMPAKIAQGSPLDCFSTPARATETCQWLDVTFNGDLLEFANQEYIQFFNALGSQHPAFLTLSNVLHGAPGGQQVFQFWQHADFSHVPVGLLSEVYEQLAHKHEDEAAKAESIHYTPRNIAAYMVEQAFSAIPEAKRPSAKCVDPACGGGVFLVLCFRRIVAEHWRMTGRRPTRRRLREILSAQIRGFDINNAALKLAALGLYLSALELDPNPLDQDGLQFRAMRGETLISTRSIYESPADSFVPGSLGDSLSQEHIAQYDLVIANPPWSAWKRSIGGSKVDCLNELATSIGRRVAKARAAMVEGVSSERLTLAENEYHNPDSVPDLAFVWRAMEWAKPSAVIALALHGRLLFKTTDTAVLARDAIFSALRVTGILNGASVRQEAVWPNVQAPWCLLFAVNEIPHDTDVFYLVSPDVEPALNKTGRVRIDYKAADPVEFGLLRNSPNLLKTLFRGTAIDGAIVQRVRSVGIPLGMYASKLNLRHGDGFQLALNTRSGKLQDAGTLKDLPELTARSFKSGRFDPRSLPLFNHPLARRPKDRNQYRAPLLIVPESLPPHRTQRGSVLALEDVAYNESFYGYSTHGLPSKDAEALARYLHVSTYSSLFYHFALMYSSKFGVERDSILKEDIDAFPIIPLEDLSHDDRAVIYRLSRELENGQVNLEELDDFVAGLYGLTSHEAQSLKDTLRTSMPYQHTRERAVRKTTDEERSEFLNVFADHVNGLFDFVDQKIAVQSIKKSLGGWQFFELSKQMEQGGDWRSDWIEALANDEGASMVTLHAPSRLVIGMLDQYRYWTPTRAILCADEVIRKHSTYLFRGGKS